MLEIYIHIPFCIRKCLYCDFLSFPADEKVKNSYMEALLAEIETEAVHYKNDMVNTVFIGGGTPSVLSAKWIEKLLCKLKKNFYFAAEPEITIEVNPGTVDLEKMIGFRKSGINRLSIGTQSTNDEELKALGRIHSSQDFFHIFEMARNAGFDNINVDLMSALPGQDLEHYKKSLKAVMELRPEHISAYSLIIEEGTPFFEKKQQLQLPSEEEERLMYSETADILEEMGYYRYEISNYALQGRECRHNIGYWKRTNYAGFGLGASSLIENVRWKNTSDLTAYINYYLENAQIVGNEGIKTEVQRLDVQEQMEEFMFLGLRLTEGISKKDFYSAFNRDIHEIYGSVMDQLQRQELIAVSERVKLTDYGRDISNYVMAQFLF